MGTIYGNKSIIDYKTTFSLWGNIMDCRNPFGLRDNKIILIEELSIKERGLRCNCVCPACKEPFEARMGEKRSHHFAHSGQGCDELNAYMTGLYMLLKEYLKSENYLYLPPVIAKFELSCNFYINDSNIEQYVKIQSWSYDKRNEEMIYDKKRVRFDSAEIVFNSNGKPQAILAIKNNKILAISIVPPDTICKTGDVHKFKDYPTLEVDLSDLGDKILTSKKEEVFDYLTKDVTIYKWVYNPNVKKAYENIKKRSKAYYEKVQECQKKEEDERRKKRKLEYETFYENEAIRRQQNEKSSKEKAKIEYNQGYEDVKDRFTQQHSQILDRFKKRWVKCEKCGSIKRDIEFVSYGGDNRKNLGICSNCNKKFKDKN